MMRKAVLALFLLMGVVVVSAQEDAVIELPAGCNALQITGTFSDLGVQEGKQGLFGTEIRLAVTARGYQAVLQFADGEPSDLSIGEAEYNTDTKYWPLGVPLPESEPDTDPVEIVVLHGPHAGRFEGKVTRTHLIGTYKFVSGRSMELDLPRTTGYWE